MPTSNGRPTIHGLRPSRIPLVAAAWAAVLGIGIADIAAITGTASLAGARQIHAGEPNPVYGAGLWSLPPQSPHRIVKQPPLLSPDDQRAKDDHAFYHGHRATIDAALVEPVWRQPYAYGYFGATQKGHWQRHFGYHRSYTQWTLK